MFDKLEKQFFNTFGIEPKKQCFNSDCIAKDEIGYNNKICDDRCVYIDKEYPQITDRILLELICILSRHARIGHYTMDGLKRQLLNLAIIHRKDILHQVQALFEEKQNDR